MGIQNNNIYQALVCEDCKTSNFNPALDVLGENELGHHCLDCGMYQATYLPLPEVRTAHCDMCSATATGRAPQLKRQGWHLGRGYEFCPDPAH